MDHHQVMRGTACLRELAGISEGVWWTGVVWDIVRDSRDLRCFSESPVMDSFTVLLILCSSNIMVDFWYRISVCAMATLQKKGGRPEHVQYRFTCMHIDFILLAKY